jgi:uncharacterized protein YbaP (TraB family)
MSNRHRILARFSTAATLAIALSSGVAAHPSTQLGVPRAPIEGQTPAGGKNFLWKVQSGTGVMYLAGSVHALTPDAYPLNPAYQRAYDAAGALVEEIALAEADPFSSGPALLAKGMYQDGRTFDRAVSRETADLVAEKLKNTPLALELIQPMKPWMVMLMLEALGSQAAGLDPGLGLDKHFYEMATGAGKTVIGLETAESQMDRFDKMPEPMQEQMLRSELAEMDTEKASLRALLTAWQTGDAAAMEKMLLSAFRSNPAADTSLIPERTRNWMPQLDACLKRASPCFVIVGAAHIVGPEGLLSMLQRRGYRVEQQ